MFFMKLTSRLSVALQLLFMLGTYAARVRHIIADSQSRAAAHVDAGTAFVPVFVGRPQIAGVHKQRGGYELARVLGTPRGTGRQAKVYHAGGSDKVLSIPASPSHDDDETLQNLPSPRLDPSLVNSVSPARKSQNKTQVSVLRLLGKWNGAAMANERRFEKRGDVKGFKLMHSTQMIISTMRDEIQLRVADHVFAMAFGEASEDNIQALASVSLRWENDDDGKLDKLARKQGLLAHVMYTERVPVVEITELVATPNERQKGSGGALVHGIISWAKEKDRLVVIVPANEKLREYYKSLGFQQMEALSSRMVYSGNQELDTASGGLLIDCLLPQPVADLSDA